MVKIQTSLPRDAQGEPDLEVWIEDLSEFERHDRARFRNALNMLKQASSRSQGAQIVELLLDLQMDADTILAGLVLCAARAGEIELHEIEGREARGLVSQVMRMGSTDSVALTNAPLLVNESRDQIDNVRHMLVALIDDPRVAIVKLAERVVAIRNAKSDAEHVRSRIAREVLDFYSPLAGRLGIWQLKWVLEDLAFRYLYEDEYRAIASRLDGRREEREWKIESVRKDLEKRLAEAGIAAEVQGRAKHIYSIWRKMREKGIDLSEVYDVQAVRVLVDRVYDCYSALGIVHTSWPHIPSEFDDYITNPKDNGYRSIHTAVIGPEGGTVEVQIRTYDMHEEAELGVCAHWTYKGHDGGALRSQKVAWLREVLDWHDELGESLGTPADTIAIEASQTRIYVSTPQGHVVDLSAGATPVDFAYRVHTEIGHRCRSARVDGVAVPLNSPLTTGQVVEIVTDGDEAPRREWLNPALGYVKTSRARQKIQNWFRAQVAESNINAGRSLLEDSFQRLNVVVDYAKLADERGYECEDRLFQAVGVGDLLVIDLIRTVLSHPVETRQLSLLPSSEQAGISSVQSITIRGADRRGLLRDVTTVLAAMSISVMATNARADAASASAMISIDLRVGSLLELARVVDRLRRIPDVHDVRRTYAS